MKTINERSGVALLAGTVIGLVVWPALEVTLHGPGVPLAIFAGLVTTWLVWRKLPLRLDGAIRRRPLAAALWILLAVATVGQTYRLGAYMADSSYDYFHTTKHEFWAKHMCMNAYIYAADLDRQGEPNIYDADHYPGLNPDADVHPTVANLTPDDPYQYPPQYLLLPRLAIALSNDFMVIRPVWYTGQVLFFFAVAVWLALRIGGSTGETALWLLPLVWIAVPTMLNFQYGQSHLAAVVLAIAALLALTKKRSAAGGALLAAAIVAKGFPGIVLIPLVLQRRWRAVAWTAGWGVAYTLITWAVLGTDVYTAFFQYHLPRLQSGEAFAFHEVWPEYLAPLLAGNISVYSLFLKLDQLGVPGMTEAVARFFQGMFTLGVVAAAVLAAKAAGARNTTLKTSVLTWFALLNLAAMTSPAAWGDYIPSGTVWMLPLVLAGSVSGRARWLWAVLAFCFLMPGVVPIADWPGPVAGYLLSILATVALAGINWYVVITERKAQLAAENSPRLAEAA